MKTFPPESWITYKLSSIRCTKSVIPKHASFTIPIKCNQEQCQPPGWHLIHQWKTSGVLCFSLVTQLTTEAATSYWSTVTAIGWESPCFIDLSGWWQLIWAWHKKTSFSTKCLSQNLDNVIALLTLNLDTEHSTDLNDIQQKGRFPGTSVQADLSLLGLQ